MKKVLIKRNGEVRTVPFDKIKGGDIVYTDGVVNANAVVCEDDSVHYSGDASYDGYLFYTPEGDSVFMEDVIESRGAEKVHVWCRVGCTLELTMNEATVIFGDDEEAAAEMLAKVILRNKLIPDGDSYIPEVSVDDFNRTYGTTFISADIGTDV